MTRKKEIMEASKKHDTETTTSPCACFVDGAEWADANPDKIDWSKATATSDMGAFNFVVRLQDEIKQLQSDRNTLVEALKHYRGLEFGETANDALKAIGEE